MAYDVAAVRSHYPALASGEVFFDGPGGTQVPQPVIDAVSRTLAGPLSNRGPHSRPQRAADDGRRGVPAARSATCWPPTRAASCSAAA